MTSWLLFNDGAHSPFFNMAMDELLLQAAGKENQQTVLRFYHWDRKSASIGFAQHWGIVPETFTCVRRLTGGGVVFHDSDLTYTLIMPQSEPLAQLPTEEGYLRIHQAVASALERCGVHSALLTEKVTHPEPSTLHCFTEPSRYDVVNGNEKFAGAAQRRTRNGVLHQGSVALSGANGNSQLLQQMLTVAFAECFHIDYIPYVPAPQYFDAAQRLGDEKYASELWSLKRRFHPEEHEAAHD